MVKQRKPNGYWKNPDNFYKEMNEVIKKNNGEFPSLNIIRKTSKGDLSTAVNYYGGIFEVMTKMGYRSRPRPKPSGYWQNSNNFEVELKKAIQENNGEFPTWNWLNDNGYIGLNSAITKYYGGLNKLRKEKGYELIRKQKGYWKDIETLINEAKKIMKKEKWNRLPSDRILVEKGYSSLNNAIIRHGGMKVIRKILGQKNNIAGQLKDLDYVLDMTKKIMKKEKWNRLPSDRILEKNGYAGLSGAIRRYHNGITNIRILLGQENYQKPRSYWKDWNNFKLGLEKAIKKNKGQFPSREELIKLGYGGLNEPMKKYFGGIYAVREKIGYNELMKKELARDLEEIAERLVG